MSAKNLIKTRTTMVLLPLLPAVFAGCESGGELEPPEYSLGREIIEAFAAHVGEDPSDIRVREGSWAGTGLMPQYPEIAEAIEAYVGEAGIAYPAWPGLPESAVFMPRVPGVIHGFWPLSPFLWASPKIDRGLPGIEIGYGGIRPGCLYSMQLEPLEGGGWKAGELDDDCSGFSSTRPWRLEDGKWVLDGKLVPEVPDGKKLVMDPDHGIILSEDPR